jgi:tetratricopeptide (TPR) repeat protein
VIPRFAGNLKPMLHTRVHRPALAGDALASPILVLGAPRSGTTWLAKIIDSHPATLYHRQSRLDDRLAALQRAAALAPDELLNWHGLELAYGDPGDLTGLRDAAERAISVRPDNAAAHSIRASVLLREGAFADGWPEYEWRLKLPGVAGGAPPEDWPRWDGSPMPDQRLLIFCDQGRGDIIQFARYSPWAADPSHAEAWRARLDRLLPRGYRRIGPVWAGNPAHQHDKSRSIELFRLRPLADVRGVAFVAMQLGGAQAQAGQFFGRAPMVNVAPEIGGFRDTMAILEILDLLISVDTSIIHLAGAMGRPAWVLLPRVADWRWLTNRDTSPWYPGMRLFRQSVVWNWEPVIGQIAQALRWGTK